VPHGSLHRTTPRIVFASSVAVYGMPGRGVVGEDDPALPALSCGAHKRMRYAPEPRIEAQFGALPELRTPRECCFRCRIAIAVLQ
jgi:hypothetical protein